MGACVITKTPSLFSNQTLVFAPNVLAYWIFLNEIEPPPTSKTVIRSPIDCIYGSDRTFGLFSVILKILNKDSYQTSYCSTEIVCLTVTALSDRLTLIPVPVTNPLHGVESLTCNKMPSSISGTSLVSGNTNL